MTGGDPEVRSMAGIKDLTGKHFGRLTVLEKTEKRQDRYVLWRCRCDCGNEIFVNTKSLTRGTISDCGCIPRKTARRGSIAEDLTGRRFGRLTVIERGENRNGRTCWLCRCDCGTEKLVPAHELKAGRSKSCGCLRRQTGKSVVDLSGQRFGRLSALYPTERRDGKGSVYWMCRCDCGNTVTVTESNLVYGTYRSCGCLRREYQENVSKNLHLIDGTCVELLGRKKRSDNTSGYPGVCRRENNRYRVYIGFKGKRFNLGTFDNYEDAVCARMDAEEKIHQGFINAYREWKERGNGNPAWEKAHPLVYEVRKAGDDFVITCKNET